MDKHWQVGKKVFETEAEAMQFAKDLSMRGCLGAWFPTDRKVTHRYIFGDDCKTERV